MTEIDRLLRRARARLWLARAVLWSGRWLLAAVTLCVVVIALNRVAGLPVPELWAFAVIGGLAVAATVVAVIFPRQKDLELAQRLDERLGLKDRLATALHLTAHRDAGSGWSAFIAEDAARAAASADPRRAVPVAAGRGWSWSAPAVAVGAVLFAFLPAGMDVFGFGERQRVADAERNAEAQAEEEQVIREAIIRDLDAAEQQLREEADPRRLMDELATLTQREMMSPEMRKEAAARLSELTEQLEETQQQQAAELQTLQNQLSRLDPLEPGPADRFADALRRGDFDAAQAELQRLAQSLEGMPAGEREALQRQLNNLAQQLQQAAENAAAQQQAAQEQTQQQLQEAGLSQQQIQQLQQQDFSQQAVQQALQQRGMTQEQARQLAQQVQQQQQQARQSGECSECQGGMSSSLSQMAQSLSQSRQGGQGEQNSRFQQGQWSTQQQLQELSQMQQQLQQMQQAQGQAQDAMQQIARGQPRPMHGPPGGIDSAGVVDDPNVFGPERAQRTSGNVDSFSDATDRPGPIITSWTTQQEGVGGEASVEIDAAVTEARTAAERAVTEDRVPRRFHEGVRDYFNQLPDAAERQRQAPAAPR